MEKEGNGGTERIEEEMMLRLVKINGKHEMYKYPEHYDHC